VNHYETLGVWRDASSQELEQRYRLLQERLGAEAELGSIDARDQLAKLERAYSVLSSPALRAEYDGALARGESGESIGAPPGETPPPPEYYRLGPLPSAGTMQRRSRSRVPPRWARFLVAIAIVIVIPWVVVHFRAQRQERSLKDSARAYAEAIVAFEHDNGGRPPLLNSHDWPEKLAGPVDVNGVPYLTKIPGYVKDHPFDVIQTRSRSGSFPSPESASIEISSTTSDYVIQYVPYGRTFSLKAQNYVYEGYLLLIDVPFQYTRTLNEIPHNCEAWGDPVQILCGDELLHRQ
jgi:hypothetical protein